MVRTIKSILAIEKDLKMYFGEMTRNKVRFDSPKGKLSIEDLWDLPLNSRDECNLDAIAVKLYNEMTSGNKTSFTKQEKTKDDTLYKKLETVKEIIRIKLMDIEQKELKEQKQVRREKLLNLLEKKNDESLEKMTKKEIMDELSKI